ncbi:MAG: TolC family protein [Prevotellaceae bacterium]|jgi:outer membrane protein TolC|nr:TolC family protein [Prevotellaceae bacterium]
MRKYIIPFFLVLLSWGYTNAQQVLNLDDCRRMAIENNKDLKIKKEQVAVAESMKKIALTQHLPNISGKGAYFHNSNNISLLSEDKFAPVGKVMEDGSFGFDQTHVNNEWTMINGQPVPLDANEQPFDPKLHPEKIKWKGYAYLSKKEFTIDNKNIFIAAISLVQPIYMGGKIRELNKIAGFAKDLALAEQEGEMSDILYSVDAAYWQVVSVSNKLKLASQFKELIQKLNKDVDDMVTEGVATKSDMLKVRVKLNEADLSVIKAQNGLNLSKMLLCQLTGMPMDSQFMLADENIKVEADPAAEVPEINEAYKNRAEIKQLEQAINMSNANIKLKLSNFLPNIGLTANYMWTNPDLYNGFKKKFKGAWNVGVAVSVPIFHWGERIHTRNAAKAEHKIIEYKLENAKEKIELQVRQSTYKINEARKRMAMTDENVASATENLRMAEEGYKEGVITLSNLMEAQVSWQSAYSERIDAAVDVKLSDVYLKKSSGNLR